MLIHKLLKKETIVESAGIILFFTIIEKVISIFKGIIFARMLGPTEYGVFTLALFFIPIVVTLAKLGIPTCYGRYVSQYERKAMLGDFLRKNYSLTLVAGIFITFLCLLFSRETSMILFNSANYSYLIIICALTIIPAVLYENLFYSFNGMRVFKMGYLLRFSQFLIFTAIGIPLVIFYPKAEYAISVNFISFVLVSSFFGYIALKYILNSNLQNIKIKENDFYRKIFKYSIWFVITPIISILFNYTDRLMLSRLLGLKEVGIYSIAINVANYLLLFGMIVGKVIMPSLSRIWENGEKDRVISLLNLGVKVNIVTTLFIAVILSLFKEQIVSILYGQPYMESIPAINMLLIFSLLTSTYWIIAAYAGIIEKTYIHLIINTIGLISNIILNYILITYYQIVGAAMATAISFSINFIIINIWLYKEGLKLRLNTILMYLIPVILILSDVVMSLIFIALVVIIFGSNFFITKDEKIILKQQLEKTLIRKHKPMNISSD